MHVEFWWGNLREIDHLEDTDVDGRIMFRWILGKWDWGGGMDWIDLAQDRDMGQAVMNVVMNLQIPYRAGNFLTS